MRQVCRWLLLFAIVALLVPAFEAQDAKKGEKKKEAAAKKEEKEPAKKAPAKKDNAKSPFDDDGEPKKDKKSEKPGPRGKEPEVVYGQIIPGVTIKHFDSNNNKDFSVDIMAPDPQKIAKFQMWQAQQMVQISRSAPNQRAQQMRQYQTQLMQQQRGIYSPTEFRVRATDNIKVRTLLLPQEFDEKGNPKKLTAKEIAALKDNSKLPGFPADLEALRIGQVVDVYLAKTAATAAATAKAKIARKADDEDLEAPRPEVVLIVIKANAKPQP